MARVNTTVPDEMKEWLDDQPHLNASGLLQKAIREEMRKESISAGGYDHGQVVTMQSGKDGVFCSVCDGVHTADSGTFSGIHVLAPKDECVLNQMTEK